MGLAMQKRRRDESQEEEGGSPRKKTRTQNKFKKKNKPLPDWMKVRPAENKLTVPREYNGRAWWYCHPDTGGKCEGVYRRHKPAECRGQANKYKFKNKNANKKQRQEQGR